MSAPFHKCSPETHKSDKIALGPMVSVRQGQDSNPGLLEPKACGAHDIDPMLLTYGLLGAAWGIFIESRDLHS